MGKITLTCSGSPKRKNPANPEKIKFVAKFVTVACKDESNFVLLTHDPHIRTLKNTTKAYLICQYAMKRVRETRPQ